jgi:hypothetical protein
LRVLEGLLRAAARVASAVVLVSFVLFAIDETREASARTAAEVAGQEAARRPVPSGRQEHARERAHGPVREAIDDANDVLLSPFAFAEPSGGGAWARRGVPALLALLVYGAGLLFLARLGRGRA